MARHLGPLALTAVSLLLASCLDDPAVRERAGLDQNGRPLPGASRFTSDTPAVATPTPSPTALTPAPSSTPSAGPTTNSSGAGVPGSTGRYTQTFDPLDVAIAGPAYFVLSTTPTPSSLNDLIFTRLGAFDLAFVSAASPTPAGAPVTGAGEWRLVSAEGLRVLGFNYAGAEGTAVPPESRSSSFTSAFTLGGSGGPSVTAAPVVIDANANLNFAPRFDFRGQLTSQQQPPLGPDGDARQIFLALAQFEHPEALVAKSGYPGYTYRSEAGAVSVGIAGVRRAEGQPARPVGEANLIRPETLER